jgi:hypothetical protein
VTRRETLQALTELTAYCAISLLAGSLLVMLLHEAPNPEPRAVTVVVRLDAPLAASCPWTWRQRTGDRLAGPGAER